MPRPDPLPEPQQRAAWSWWRSLGGGPVGFAAVFGPIPRPEASSRWPTERKDPVPLRLHDAQLLQALRSARVARQARRKAR